MAWVAAEDGAPPRRPRSALLAASANQLGRYCGGINVIGKSSICNGRPPWLPLQSRGNIHQRKMRPGADALDHERRSISDAKEDALAIAWSACSDPATDEKEHDFESSISIVERLEPRTAFMVIPCQL